MAGAAGRTYVDFTPPHSLQEEHDKVVLRVDLSAEGFKKEQLRVQIDNYGRLRISGERPLRADNNRWRRFSEDFHVPEGCDAGGVRARLEKGGVLLITMPRLSPTPAQDPTAAAGANACHTEDTQNDHTGPRQEAPPATAAAGAEEERKEDHKEEDGARGASSERRGQDEQHATSSKAGGAASDGRPVYGFAKSRKGVVWAIVAVILALVGAGLYARFKLMDPSAETAPTGSQIVPFSDH